MVVSFRILSNILVFQWDELRSSDATVINGNIAGQSDYAQAYMKEPMSAENLIYTWSIKIVNLSNPTSAGTSLGMATYPPAHGVDGFNDYDHRFEIFKYFQFRCYCRSLIYRVYNGEVYGSSKGTLKIENSTVGDVITMTYNRALRHFYIQKV